MKVAIHQPDLLPYSGFWFKMATSDAFVLAVHDQFQKHGYQRRVKMRDTWVSHQLVGKPALVPINTIEVQPGWQGRLVDAIRGRYTGARHFKARSPELLEHISAAEGTRLDEVNLALIEIVRHLLGISTPLLTPAPPSQTNVDRLIEQVSAVGGTQYLSGTGGLAYMGEDAPARFRDAGIELVWSNHAMTTGDSIVTVLMDHDDPMESVLARH
ncbi:MAG: WbqC family protein [Dermatophilaceae bacterium]